MVWFPIRLVGEFWKLVDLTEKPDRRREAEDLFREAYSLSLDLAARGAFADSVLRDVETPPALRAVFHDAIGKLYAEH